MTHLPHEQRRPHDPCVPNLGGTSEELPVQDYGPSACPASRRRSPKDPCPRRTPSQLRRPRSHRSPMPPVSPWPPEVCCGGGRPAIPGSWGRSTLSGTPNPDAVQELLDDLHQPAYGGLSPPLRRSPSQPPITCTRTLLLLGPSNSAKKMACQVPSKSLPPDIGTSTELPSKLAFMWASAFPSKWW